jgi:hypothetical protein
MQNDVEVQETRPLPMLIDADQPPEASAAGDPMASATVNAMVASQFPGEFARV